MTVEPEALKRMNETVPLKELETVPTQVEVEIEMCR
jgi:hypothetical protein